MKKKKIMAFYVYEEVLKKFDDTIMPYTIQRSTAFNLLLSYFLERQSKDNNTFITLLRTRPVFMGEKKRISCTIDFDVFEKYSNLLSSKKLNGLELLSCIINEFINFDIETQTKILFEN